MTTQIDELGQKIAQRSKKLIFLHKINVVISFFAIGVYVIYWLYYFLFGSGTSVLSFKIFFIMTVLVVMEIDLFRRMFENLKTYDENQKRWFLRSIPVKVMIEIIIMPVVLFLAYYPLSQILK